MSITELQNMTTVERLEAMEQIWYLLAHDAQELPSPDWHESVLHDRMDKLQSGEAKFYTLDQVKSHFS